MTEENFEVEKKDLDAEFFHIGIIGTNATAKALEYAFSNKPRNAVMVVDGINKHIQDLIDWEPQITFLCNEVIYHDDGLVEATELEDHLLQLSGKSNSGIVVRTALPIDLIERVCKNQRVVYNPELVYDTDSIDARIHVQNMILGGSPSSTMAVLEVYHRFSTFNISHAVHVSPVEASFIEQATSSALVMKSVFYNQLYDVVSEFGGDYHTIASCLSGDSRIGTFGMRVPNTRGSRGYDNEQAKRSLKSLVRFNERFTLLKECDTMNDRYQERD